jgi:colanic acid biosynthesis glycosyl transferase WcaI
MVGRPPIQRNERAAFVRVAYFTQWWPPENAALPMSLARELATRRHDVNVITGFPNYPSGRLHADYPLRWRRIDTVEGLRTVRVPLYPSHDQSAIRRSANFLSFSLAASTIGLPHLRGVDVAYVYHPPITAAWPAMLLRRLRGVPFVLHVQDLWPESVTHSGMVSNPDHASIFERALGHACAMVYRAAAHIVVISPGFKQLLIERGVPAHKITVVYNWADDDVFRPTQPDSACRAELGPTDSRIVLYAGNLGDYQNLDAAILAAERIGNIAPLHLVLIGDGIARTRLQQLITSRRIRNVSLLAPRSFSQMPPLLAAADVHLVSLQDLSFFAATVPGKTQVAMASGKPMIMAVRGDAADLVQKAECGFVCEPNELGIAEAMASVARSTNDELLQLGQSGRRFYRDHLSLAAATTQIEECLQTAAGTTR